MKTSPIVLASFAALGAALGLVSCAPDRASVQMQAICYPTDDCKFSATCDAVLIGTPGIDIGTSTSDTLVLFVQVANQMPNNGNTQIGRLNTNDAHVDEIVTEYEGAKGGTVYTGTNQWVPAGGSTVIGLALGPFTALGDVLARVKLRGYFDDGTRFETGDFPIAIGVCTNCITNQCVGAPSVCPRGALGQVPLACGS